MSRDSLDWCFWSLPRHASSVENRTELGEWMSYIQVAWFFNGLFTSSFAIIGIAGNIASIFYIHLRKKSMKRSMALYSMTLAGSDALLCFSALSAHGLSDFLIKFTGGQTIFEYLAWTFHPMLKLTSTATCWMLVLIVSARHQAVWRPLKFRVIDTTTRARVLAASVLGASALYSLPVFFELRLNSCRHFDEPTRISVFLSGTQLRNNKIYNYIYRILGSLTFTALGPFVLISVLSVRIIVFVYRSSAQWRLSQPTPRSGRTSRQETAVTYMLIGLASKFLICRSLPTALNIWETYLRFTDAQGIFPPSAFFVFFVNLSNFLVLFNSATDCFIYFYYLFKDSRMPRRTSNVENHRLQSLDESRKSSTYEIRRSIVTSSLRPPQHVNGIRSGQKIASLGLRSFEPSQLKLIAETWPLMSDHFIRLAGESLQKDGMNSTPSGKIEKEHDIANSTASEGNESVATIRLKTLGHSDHDLTDGPVINHSRLLRFQHFLDSKFALFSACSKNEHLKFFEEISDYLLRNPAFAQCLGTFFWREVKSVTMNLVRLSVDPQRSEEIEKVWNMFICALISAVKRDLLLFSVERRCTLIVGEKSY